LTPQRLRRFENILCDVGGAATAAPPTSHKMLYVRIVRNSCTLRGKEDYDDMVIQSKQKYFPWRNTAMSESIELYYRVRMRDHILKIQAQSF